MTYQTYNFTGFKEADILGDNNGSSFGGRGEKFVMPAQATTNFSVTDNDAFLSGDSWCNEHANDRTGQAATITDCDGNVLQNCDRIYAEQVIYLKGSDGKMYTLVEIELEGGNAPGAGDDFFTFYNGGPHFHGTPPAGVTLTVVGRANVRTNYLDYKCLWEDDKLANNDPVAQNDAATVMENAQAATVFNVLSNDTDVDSDDLQVVEVNGQSAAFGEWFAGENGGEFRLSEDGSVEFRQGSNEFDSLGEGEELLTSFTYTISDGNGGLSTATATVTVTGKNDGPVAVDDNFGTISEDAGNISIFGTGDRIIERNDFDVDGDELTIAFVNGDNPFIDDGGVRFGEAFEGSNGGMFTVFGPGGFVDFNATFDGNGDFDYLKEGETTTTSFEYTITDGNGGFDTATVTVTIEGKNDGPVATADTGSTDSKTPITIDVLANDTDVDGDALSIESFSDPAGGEVEIVDGKLVYTPDTGFSGTDVFEYTITDEFGASSTAEVSVDVTGTDPVAPSGPQNFFKIGDTVWLDEDGDGRLDANEGGVSGVLVTLTGAGDDGQFGTADDYTATYTTGDLLVTDDGKVVDLGPGGYRFDNLTPGDYQLEFDLPEGYDFTIQDAPGTKEFNDSDVDPETGLITGLTLVEGDTTPKILTADAGIIKKDIVDVSINKEATNVTKVRTSYDASTGGWTNADDDIAYGLDIMRYDITVTNNSDTAATGIVVEDIVPENIDLAQPGQTISDTGMGWNESGRAFDSRFFWGQAYQGSVDVVDPTNGAVTLVDPGTAPQGLTLAPGENYGLSEGAVTWELGEALAPGESVTLSYFGMREVYSAYNWQVGTEFNTAASITEIDQHDSNPDNNSDSARSWWISPITFDLNGDGIQTRNIDQGVKFDMLNTGDAVNTGWLSGDDGFLAVDNNGDGLISSRAELFGGLVGDGFAKLSTFDSNGDGLVNGRDAQFDELKLWQDANENGFTDKGELVSLEAAGISDLSLDYTNVFSKDANGNIHGEVSSAVKNGSTIEMTDVYFQVAV